MSDVPRGMLLLAGYGVPDGGLLPLRVTRALQTAALVLSPTDAPVWFRAPVQERGTWTPVDGAPLAPGQPLWDSLITLLQQGESVVRGYPTDPLSDPAGAAEVAQFHAAALPLDIVPTPHPAHVAATYAGLAWGDHDPMLFLTAERLEDADPVPTGTTVFVPLQACDRVGAVAEGLVRAGMAPDAPVVVIAQAGTPRQQVQQGRLGAVPADAAGPCMVIAGPVARARLSWFEQRPLFGQRVLVTRAAEQAATFSDLLRAAGAEPVELPVIQTVPPADLAPLDAAVQRLASYHWVLFTSANTVDALFARLDHLGLDARAFGSARIAAIGPGTTARLRQRGLRADFEPPEFVAEALAEGLIAQGVAGQRVLLPRAAKARDVLPEALGQAGAVVDVVAAYQTVPPTVSDTTRSALRRLEAGEIDVITLTSSSTARNLVALVGGQVELLNRATVACIGPVAAGTARELGLRVDLVARDYSIPGLVAALVDAQGRSQR